MRTSYYQPGASRAARVGDLFATIASRYDLINDLQSFGMHRVWKRRLVREALIRPGQRALDLCCGTGDVAFRLAQAGACVIGCDFSLPMLDMGRRRRGAQFQLAQGDALRLPLLDATMDIVTISYGLRNLSDFSGGLRECWRILRPGGRVLILDFGKPPDPVWRSLYFAYLRRLVPLFGTLFHNDPATHAYIHESLLHYPAQNGVDSELRQLGADWSEIILLWEGVMTINHARKPW